MSIKNNKILSKLVSLERMKRSKKRKISPNTTQRDGDIGILIHFFKHDKEATQETNLNKIASLKKYQGNKHCAHQY